MVFHIFYFLIMCRFYAIDYCINGSIAILTIKDEDVEKLVSSFAIGETAPETATPRQGTILAPVNMAIPFVACAGWVEKKGNGISLLL